MLKSSGRAPVRWRRRIDADQHHAHVVVTDEAALHRLDRHDDHIVLVAKAALPARRQHADDVAADIAQPDARAHRVAGREQVLAHGIADQAHRLARLLLRRRPIAPGGERPRLHRVERQRRAVDRRRPVRAFVDGGGAGVGLRRDRCDARDLRRDRVGIADLERRRGRTTATPAKALAGSHLQHVAAQRADLLLHRGRRRLAQRHHRDDRADADDDAQDRQERAQQMPPDRPDREDEGGA
ncbi:hypothetical protein WR25_24756 [Diploscapter pachys]|uniref:Uncharacterized protein n=1 Tax=Diploscapter pachys TaxID=2018661 RepID=A0A2A2M422_9BILA|nr:hypothetical protein WR25_24756 [Diploscapter pachys]